MSKIADNSGSFDVLKSLSGSKVKAEPETDKPKTKEQDEWEEELQRKWLSIHNDFLFTRIY